MSEIRARMTAIQCLLGIELTQSVTDRAVIVAWSPLASVSELMQLEPVELSARDLRQLAEHFDELADYLDPPAGSASGEWTDEEIPNDAW